MKALLVRLNALNAVTRVKRIYVKLSEKMLEVPVATMQGKSSLYMTGKSIPHRICTEGEKQINVCYMCNTTY